MTHRIRHIITAAVVAAVSFAGEAAGAPPSGVSVKELPEVVVESRRNKALHILAYVREYSTLASYTDTVFLFREKMVDFMLPPRGKGSFRGWTSPRVLTCRSYYRFTYKNGLDSVSDERGHHFSWSDWIGLAPAAQMPVRLRHGSEACDTVPERYGPAETWTRNGSRISADIDVLADESERRWVPGITAFFSKGLDFRRMRMRFDYSDTDTGLLSPFDLEGYSFIIESEGRGHRMFRFVRRDEPVFVSTEAEVSILDREYITLREARKWEKQKFDTDETGICHEQVRLPPDHNTQNMRFFCNFAT